MYRSGVNPADAKRWEGLVGPPMPPERVAPLSDGGDLIDAVEDRIPKEPSVARLVGQQWHSQFRRDRNRPGGGFQRSLPLRKAEPVPLAAAAPEAGGAADRSIAEHERRNGQRGCAETGSDVAGAAGSYRTRLVVEDSGTHA